MPRKRSPEKLIQQLIDEALRSYITAAKNRRRALQYCNMAFKANTWKENAARLSNLAGTLARVCDTISHELQTLYAIEERLRQVTDKGLHMVIEHVESHWRPKYAQSADEGKTVLLQEDASPQIPPSDTEKNDA